MDLTEEARKDTQDGCERDYWESVRKMRSKPKAPTEGYTEGFFIWWGGKWIPRCISFNFPGGTLKPQFDRAGLWYALELQQGGSSKTLIDRATTVDQIDGTEKDWNEMKRRVGGNLAFLNESNLTNFEEREHHKLNFVHILFLCLENLDIEAQVEGTFAGRVLKDIFRFKVQKGDGTEEIMSFDTRKLWYPVFGRSVRTVW